MVSEKIGPAGGFDHSPASHRQGPTGPVFSAKKCRPIISQRTDSAAVFDSLRRR